MSHLHNPLETDLSTASTEELWDEFKSRFTNCIVIFTQEGKQKGTVCNQYWWHGSHSEALGLIKLAEIRFTQLLIEDCRDD